MSRKNLFSLAALLLAAAAATAQPTIWVTNGWSNSATSTTTSFTRDGATNHDPRFHDSLHFSMSWDTYYPTLSGYMADRTPATIADRIANEVDNRDLKSENFSLFLDRFGLRGVESGMSSSTAYSYPNWYSYPTDDPSDYPDLFGASSAKITVTYGTSPSTYTRDERTPWLHTAAQDMAGWTESFLIYYSTYDLPAPSRLIFDNEIPMPTFTSPAEAVAFWTAITGNSKWSTEAVPGFGTSTMANLWSARPSGVIAPAVPSTNKWEYVLLDPDNQKWFEWLTGIYQTAYAGAMDEAVYQVVASYWPDTLCSDYYNTMRVDGGTGEDGTAANTIVGSNDPGSCGPVGFRTTLNAPGSNIIMAPSFYCDQTWNAWNRFRTIPVSDSTVTRTKWGNTDDGGTHIANYSPSGGAMESDGFHAPRGTNSSDTTYQNDEFWWEGGQRHDRFVADALVRSNGGSQPPIAAWVNLPNEPMEWWGYGMYDGITYSDQCCGRLPLAAVYRNLAMCRSRGINELMVWNDTGDDTGQATDASSYGVHPNYPANWNAFKRAVDLVWGYDLTSFYVDTSDSLPQGLSTSQMVARLSKSDRDYSSLSNNRVLTTAPSTAGMWVVPVFKKNSSSISAPQYLNFEFELSQSTGHAASPVYLYIADYANSVWHPIGQPGASGNVADSDGRRFVSVQVNDKTLRMRTRIPYSSNYLDSTGGIHIALYSNSTDMTWYIDLAQCFGSDESLRQMGDFNGDGAVDSADNTHFYHLYNNRTTHYIYHPLAMDFNHDGSITSADKDIWDALYDNSTVTSGISLDHSGWPFDYIDDARQMGTDLRPKP